MLQKEIFEKVVSAATPAETQSSQMPYEKFKHFPFYEWDNNEYRNFMIQLLLKLEVRRFESQEIVYDNLQTIDEFYFI